MFQTSNTLMQINGAGNREALKQTVTGRGFNKVGGNKVGGNGISQLILK
jgi:hypothetical protein